MRPTICVRGRSFLSAQQSRLEDFIDADVIVIGVPGKSKLSHNPESGHFRDLRYKVDLYVIEASELIHQVPDRYGNST